MSAVQSGGRGGVVATLVSVERSSTCPSRSLFFTFRRSGGKENGQKERLSFTGITYVSTLLGVAACPGRLGSADNSSRGIDTLLSFPDIKILVTEVTYVREEFVGVMF